MVEDSRISGAVQAFREAGTAVVSDALDRLGVTGQALGIKRVSGTGVMCGPAFTVRYEMSGVDGGTVGDYIDDVVPGSVVLLANGGRCDMTVWGGLLSGVAVRRAIAGTVIDGVCRDADSMRALGYSMFARGCYMRTGKDRVRAQEIQSPVSFAGIRVRPGDLVVGDGDGVVLVPTEYVDATVTAVEEIRAVETAIAVAAASGQRLDEARKTYGYHGVQRRTTNPSEPSHG
jgi:4-hydroxy-4-methyl-2-oxoglutarate aldolase